MALHLFAGLRVRDFQAALPWYERMFGEPLMFPNDLEAVWELGDSRFVYIVEHPEAGHSVATVMLDDSADLDARVDAIDARGLEPDERETYDNGVRKITYHDPDGNEIAFGSAPVDA